MSNTKEAPPTTPGLRERLDAYPRVRNSDLDQLLCDASNEIFALASLSPPVVEGAVAWRMRDASLFGDIEWRYLDLKPLNDYAEVEPLYAAPAPAQQAVTDDMVHRAMVRNYGNDWRDQFPGNRAAAVLASIRADLTTTFQPPTPKTAQEES